MVNETDDGIGNLKRWSHRTHVSHIVFNKGIKGYTILIHFYD